MYVIQRVPDGAFVALLGHHSSYVKALQQARIFMTRNAALQEHCPENERIVNVLNTFPTILVKLLND